VADLFKLQDQVVARLAIVWVSNSSRRKRREAHAPPNPDAIDSPHARWALVEGRIATTEGQEHCGARLVRTGAQNRSERRRCAGGEAYTYVIERGYGITRRRLRRKNTRSGGPGYRARSDTLWAYYANASTSTIRIAQIRRSAPPMPDSRSIRILVGFGNERHRRIVFLAVRTSEVDLLQAMRLSPRDPLIGFTHKYLGDAELGLGHFDAAIDEYHKAIEAGFRFVWVYASLTAAYALEGKMEEAKPPWRKPPLEPKTHRQMDDRICANIPSLLEGLRKAGLPEEEAAHLSIVVLPFTNLSNDPNQDYFADGITENLTTDLSRIRTVCYRPQHGLHVQGQKHRRKEIGKELGVRYVLEGSVQRDQNACA